MQVYWGSMFILPVSVSKAVEKLMRNFLWSGDETGKGRAKVSWKEVCLPKVEGGLGIKPMILWNQAMMAFHVWSVVSNRQSIWVKWIHTYRLKGRSFWEVKVPWDSSWSWRKILNLRNVCRPFFKTKIGNGLSTFFWQDSWIGDIPLASRITPRDIAAMGSSGNVKVDEYFVNNEWCWPSGLIAMFPEINFSQVAPLVIESGEVNWVSRRGKIGKFQTKQAWKDMVVSQPIVDWFGLVWFSNCIPKFSFILWLAIKKKLMTQDRMQNWQTDRRLACVFCDM